MSKIIHTNIHSYLQMMHSHINIPPEPKWFQCTIYLGNNWTPVVLHISMKWESLYKLCGKCFSFHSGSSFNGIGSCKQTFDQASQTLSVVWHW